jgi:hypothetical protein
MNEQDEKALAVLDAVADVVTGRVKRYNDKVNKEIIAGKTPHPETLLKQDRAIDLADHYTAARAHLSSVVAERDDERNRANKLGIELGVVRGRLEDAEFRAERAEAELARVRQAMAVAVRHIEMADLRISHKKDAALIDFSLAPKESNDGNG